LLIDSISRIARELSGTSKPHNTSGGGAEGDSTLKDLLEDLKRMCCSSEYMFFYAQELLTGTEDALKQRFISQKRKASESVAEAEEGEAPEDTGPDLNDQWRKKMRRLSQELEKKVVWADSNENILPLSRSRSFSLRLTRLFGNQLITDDLPANQTISGMHLHRLLHLLSSILDDDDLTDPKIAELCEIFFGYSPLSAPLL
jgi:hypothetical protein